eukprot:3100321-Amphidinium_carterae.4
MPLRQIGLEGLQGVHEVTAEHVQTADSFASAVSRSIRQKLLAWRHDILSGNKVCAHPTDVMNAVHSYWDPIMVPSTYQGLSQQSKEMAISAIGPCCYLVPPLTSLELQQSAASRSESVPGLDHVSLATSC